MDISEKVKKAILAGGTSPYAISMKYHGKPSEETIKLITKGVTKNPGILTLMAIGQPLGLTVSQLIGEAEPPRQIQREPRTWDDLRDCLESLGIVDTESVLRLVKQLPRSKDSGKRQLG